MKKNCLITGINGALGSALARDFLLKGYHVIGMLRKGKAIQETLIDCELYTLDLTDEEQVSQVVAQIKTKHANLDLAIFTAGGFAMGDLMEMSLDQLNRMVKINFHTAFYISREICKVYKPTGAMHLFFVGSSQVINPEKGTGAAAYTLAKALLYNWVLMLDRKGRKQRIRSHLLIPGIIDTPANRKAMPSADFHKWDKPEDIAVKIEEEIQSDHPLQIISMG